MAAIPHETRQQQRQQLMLTNTVGRSQTRPFARNPALPPFIAEGLVHVPHSLGNIGSKLTADPGVFGRFISITDAKLILPGGGEVAAPVLLLNRDLIAGISVTEERRSREDSLQRTA